jgi:uncharacterized protein involved in exopolysaccharide biosynthesis
MPKQEMQMENDIDQANLVHVKDEEDDDEISFVDLAAILWKHKRLILGITFAVLVCVLVYTIGSLLLPSDKSYLPNVYTPQATMLIQSNNSSSLSSLLSSSGLSSLAGLAGLSTTTGNTNGELAIALASSNTTLDRLNQKFDFVKHYDIRKKEVVFATRQEIKKHLKAEIDDKSGIFTVSFTDVDPSFAKDVVNEIVNILSERFALLTGSKALEQKTLLEKRLADVDSAINELEAKVKAFQSKYGVVQVDALASEQITILARLRSELILKEMEIENYKKVARINDPVLEQLNNEREGLLAKIKEMEVGTGSGSKVMPSQQQLPTIAFEYAKLERDLAVQTELFKILTQQYELAKFNAAGQEPVFQILETAEVPDKKSGPSRSMIVIITALVGFVLAICIAFIVDHIQRLKDDPETVARFKALSSKKGTV